MNTEAIIEKLLLIEEEQILNTPLEELDLSIRVYRGLRRSRVRTVRDVTEIWNRNLNVRNIGERARREILGALQAWCLSLPNFTNPATAQTQTDARDCEPDRRLPIEALHLSRRTYRALKRNQIDTLDDLYREWDRIASTRNIGPATMGEIQKALESPHPSWMRPTTHLTRETARPAADRKDPNPEPPPAQNGFAEQSTADGYGIIQENLTKKHVITDSGAVVSVELLQAEEPRKPREERWKNVSRGQLSPKPQDYAPKNIFQAIGKGEDKIADPIQRPKKGQDEISSPIRRQKKALDVSGPKYTQLLRKSLETLEKANRPRKVRNLTCPLCRAFMKSIEFEKHLVDMHPQAFQELQNAVSGSLGWQNIPGVGLVFRDPWHENHTVKCPLCEHRDRYRSLHAHIRDSHPEVNPGLVINRFNRANKSKDYVNLIKYQAELNELIKEYERLKQGQEESRDGSQ